MTNAAGRTEEMQRRIARTEDIIIPTGRINVCCVAPTLPVKAAAW